MHKRMIEARSLKSQGLTLSQIAKKMGLKKSTIAYYVYQTESYRAKIRERKIREKIQQICKMYGLLEQVNVDELFDLTLEYLKHKAKHFGSSYKLVIESVLVLYLRRKRIPTPKSLWKATTQGRGARRLSHGYMDALKLLNGVSPAKPQDYIQTYPTTNEVRAKATEILQEYFDIRRRQGKNPRVIAGACLYATGLFSQEEIATKLQISTVGLRNYWRIMAEKYAKPKKIRSSRRRELIESITQKEKEKLRNEFPKVYAFVFEGIQL